MVCSSPSFVTFTFVRFVSPFINPKPGYLTDYQCLRRSNMVRRSAVVAVARKSRRLLSNVGSARGKRSLLDVASARLAQRVVEMRVSKRDRGQPVFR